MVQEYERAVIFRLGRLLKSGARGPGVFFIIPCVDHYEKIDMRTQTYDVPPQEVCLAEISTSMDSKLQYVYRVENLFIVELSAFFRFYTVILSFLAKS